MKIWILQLETDGLHEDFPQKIEWSKIYVHQESAIEMAHSYMRKVESLVGFKGLWRLNKKNDKESGEILWGFDPTNAEPIGNDRLRLRQIQTEDN